MLLRNMNRNDSDWEIMNEKVTCDVRNSSGKKGNTPPQSEVALMARYRA